MLKYFRYIILFSFFSFFYYQSALAIISKENVSLIGFRLDSALVQDTLRSINITYQNNGKEDFLGTVYMTCGIKLQEKVAEDKSILIFKDGGQESALLTVKISESGESLPCVISIKDRNNLIVNSLSLNIKVMSSQEIFIPNKDFSSSSQTSSLSFSNNLKSFSGLSDFYNDFLNKKDSFLKDKGDINLIDISNKINRNIPIINSLNLKTISKVDEENLDNKNSPSFNLNLQGRENVFSKTQVYSDNFLRNYFGEDNLIFKILSFISGFIFSFLSGLHSFFSSFFAKLFSYFLPMSASSFLGQNWLGILIVFYTILSFKKKKKRYLQDKESKERFMQGGEYHGNQDSEDEDEDENSDQDYKAGRYRENSDKRNHSIKKNLEKPKKEINNHL